MGTEMTRQQIEAWLALEGWESIKFLYYVPMFRKGNELVYVTNFGAVKYREARSHETSLDCTAPVSRYTDEQLQLIYQEIIKHEKD